MRAAASTTSRRATSIVRLIRPACDLGWLRRQRRASRTFNGRCSMRLRRRRSQPGSSSSARTVATASVSRFPSRSRCSGCSDRTAAPERGQARSRRHRQGSRDEGGDRGARVAQLKALAARRATRPLRPEKRLRVLKHTRGTESGGEAIYELGSGRHLSVPRALARTRGRLAVGASRRILWL